MKIDKEAMDKEVITILTSEPCASWLRERWELKESDQVYIGGEVVSVVYSAFWKSLIVRSSIGDVFIESNGEFYDTDGYLTQGWDPEKEQTAWLPRVGDFLDLLIQAGAYWCCIETDMIEIDKTGGNVKDQRYCVEIWVFCNGTDTERDFRSKDKLLACAQALEWLLGQREK